ncbi:MAG: Hypoxic response protein 1 [Candidatus Dichloromethanomonas elyunquensis]|nr:MAG: Hypoxic response protein 1 [Candidatus Dichloromethanomonas elyunquensis]
MKVKDIMSSNVSFVDDSAKIPEIALIMKQQNIGAVPVVQNNQVTGIITDRDIVLKVLADKKDVNQTTASQVMTTHPVCIEENSNIDQAANLMAEYQVKRLPVLSEGKLVGMIALGDLAIEHIHVDEAGEALSGISKGITH